MEIEHLLNELFQAQEDWSVTTTGSTYTITPQPTRDPVDKTDGEQQQM